jgi:cob(I)alamin adenosyltransferase
MHELAGRGDDGTTGLLGGGRAAKDDLRIEAYGTVDEASSALGLARALTAEPGVREIAERLQRGLYRLGAELATNPEQAGKFGATGPADVARTVVRRAERRVLALTRAGGLANPEVGRYLNRLSLLLFVLGRFEEARAGTPARLARG